MEADSTADEAERRSEPAPIPADSPSQPASHRQFLRPGIPPMTVVMISPELSPAAKIGGLADVVFGLSRELEMRGNSVEIILPKYDCLKWQHIYGLAPVYQDLWVPWGGGAIHCTVYGGFVYGRKGFFIEPHSPDRFFERGKIYGDNDDVLRFAFFSRAALEYLFKAGKHPDIIHCHDWQTAQVPVFLYEIYQSLGMRHPRVCFTIHNFKHQGECGEQVLRATGLNRPAHFFHPDRLGGGRPGTLNLMKGGVVYSNFVNTVSPTYAGEAKDRGGAFGLEPALHTHHRKYGGILNGIDYEVWNPEKDGHIPAQYSTAMIERKYDNKRALRQRLLLADNARPIIAYVGRLDAQKGLDLVRHAIFYCVNHGAQFVLLGNAAEPQTNDHFRRIKQQINENPDSHLEIGFDEELSHLIYAGADMLIVPSRFEPCGLTQLIAMRYGTIPIVRAVGGLADTVFDKDYADKPLSGRNGFVFHHDDIRGIESALSRAIACYYMYPDHFRQLMLNAMRCDFSWNVPGQHYLNIYDFIRDK
ncbi:MAG: glycogen synthase [Opitutaceae bacterium]|nr:glycogen synthase [Opitutaceae bacterium]